MSVHLVGDHIVDFDDADHARASCTAATSSFGRPERRLGPRDAAVLGHVRARRWSRGRGVRASTGASSCGGTWWTALERPYHGAGVGAGHDALTTNQLPEAFESWGPLLRPRPAFRSRSPRARAQSLPVPGGAGRCSTAVGGAAASTSWPPSTVSGGDDVGVDDQAVAAVRRGGHRSCDPRTSLRVPPRWRCPCRHDERAAVPAHRAPPGPSGPVRRRPTVSEVGVGGERGQLLSAVRVEGDRGTLTAAGSQGRSRGVGRPALRPGPSAGNRGTRRSSDLAHDVGVAGMSGRSRLTRCMSTHRTDQASRSSGYHGTPGGTGTG